MHVTVRELHVGTEASVEASILPSTSTSSSSASTSAQQLLVADICRNVLDVLQALPESISQDVTALTSWCGAAEVCICLRLPKAHVQIERNYLYAQMKTIVCAMGACTH